MFEKIFLTKYARLYNCLFRYESGWGDLIDTVNHFERFIQIIT